MWNQYSKATHLHFIDNVLSDEISSGAQELTWNSLLEILTTHDVRQDKDGTLMIPAIFKEEKDLIKNAKGSYRIDENIEFITMTVLDLDEPGALDAAQKIFSDFDYVIYSTHSYTKDTPYKARIAIRHEDPLPADKLNDYVFNLAHCIDLDPVCKNKSRAFYLPSISTTAGIDPLVMVNNGRGITFEDSLILKETKGRELSKDHKNAIDRNFLKVNYKKTNSQLFNNTSSGESNISANSSFDYEDMNREYAGIIKSKLQFGDSRFQFSRAVIWHAVSVNGANVDWHNLVQFLHQTTINHGTKQFQDGNTTNELDDMIRSTLVKIIPSYLTENPTYTEEALKTVYNACGVARQSMRTGNWNYNLNSIKAEIESGKTATENDFTYESMLSRSRSCDHQLLRNDDVVGYIIDVIKNEVDSYGKNIDINSVGQFALFRASKYLKSNDESITTYKDTIFSDVTIDEIDPVSKLSPVDRESMQRFLNTSLKLGYLSATKQRNFDLTRTKNKEIAPAP